MAEERAYLAEKSKSLAARRGTCLLLLPARKIGSDPDLVTMIARTHEMQTKGKASCFINAASDVPNASLVSNLSALVLIGGGHTLYCRPLLQEPGTWEGK